MHREEDFKFFLQDILAESVRIGSRCSLKYLPENNSYGERNELLNVSVLKSNIRRPLLKGPLKADEPRDFRLDCLVTQLE